MEPLLHINTIPIAIKINMIDGEFEMNPELPKANVDKQEGKLFIKADDAKINIDSYAARRSLGLMTTSDFNQQAVNKAKSVIYQGTARIVSEGNELVDLTRGSSPAEIQKRKNRSGATIETFMEFLPTEGADISFKKGELSIDYQMGNVKFDWDVHKDAPIEFKPGKIEIIVEQKPAVEIEYVGGPIYFPLDSNPIYTGEMFSGYA